VRSQLAEEKYFRTVWFPEPLTREVYEMLARDPEPKLLGAADPAVASGAAANRALPVEAMRQLLDRAGL
jgi:hypothetical protein